MKANAPEKLYILFNHPYTVDYAKLNKRRYEEEVEYTRTDAFIEKACDAYCKLCKMPNCRSKCKWIDDFKKAMEE